jgi:hypothetical protein
MGTRWSAKAERVRHRLDRLSRVNPNAKYLLVEASKVLFHVPATAVIGCI